MDIFQDFSQMRQIGNADSNRGYKDFVNVQGWNSMGWGNTGVTLGLLLVRILYLMGALGQVKTKKATEKNI